MHRVFSVGGLQTRMRAFLHLARIYTDMIRPNNHNHINIIGWYRYRLNCGVTHKLCGLWERKNMHGVH